MTESVDSELPVDRGSDEITHHERLVASRAADRQRPHLKFVICHLSFVISFEV
jgi:hypothetical protein